MGSTVPVLIIGAGPAGLTTAIELHRHKIPFRILDKNKKPVKTSNALAIHARTLEIWEEQGLLEKALAKGVIIKAVDFYEHDQHILHLSLDLINSVYPFTLSLPQNLTEELLTDFLKENNIFVEMEKEVTSIEEKEQHVICKTKNTHGEIEEINADWVITCDGAHSFVRKYMNIPFVGNEAHQHFVLADFNSKSPLLSQSFFIFLSNDGPLIVAQFSKKECRIIADVSHDNDLKNSTTVSYDQLKKLVSERCPYVFDVQEPSWTSGFTIRERLTKKFRHGKIFFVGDAAHVHSPAGGQGLNMGIQDAVNLSWKLAFVIQNKANAAILNTYHNERYPLAKSVLRSTAALTRFISINTRFFYVFRRFILNLLATFRFLRKRLTTQFSQTGIRYTDNYLTQDHLFFLSGPLAGTSLLDIQYALNKKLSDSLRGIENYLIFFGGENDINFEEAMQLRDRIAQKYRGIFKFILINKQKYFASWTDQTIFDENHLIHNGYRIKVPSIYFIRPDKHIGFRGKMTDKEKLMKYLEKIFI